MINSIIFDIGPILSIISSDMLVIIGLLISNGIISNGFTYTTNDLDEGNWSIVTWKIMKGMVVSGLIVIIVSFIFFKTNADVTTLSSKSHLIKIFSWLIGPLSAAILGFFTYKIYIEFGGDLSDLTIYSREYHDVLDQINSDENDLHQEHRKKGE